MVQGNMKAFTRDIEDWVLSTIDYQDTYVTEQGDVEDWKNDTSNSKEKIMENLKEFLDVMKTHLEE